jgi:hypothetical protein
MKRIILFITGISLLTFNACKKHDDHDHDDHNHDNELITTVELKFIDATAGDTLSFEWSQPAGLGTAITVDTINLKPGKTYQCSVELYDKSKTPANDLTLEIEEAANEHRFIYTSSTTRLSTQITDFDTQNPPMELGLKFNAITTATGPVNGTLKAILRHYTSSSPKSGGLANGSIDVDVSFPVTVE